MSDGENGNRSWSTRYGVRHQLERVTKYPEGVDGPKKVRIYRRRNHYILQWWDPEVRSTLSDRVEGDLVTALVRARDIDSQILHFRSAGKGELRRVLQPSLVDAFKTDLSNRADAGEIDPGTVKRYGAALNHYLAYCNRPNVHKQFRYAGSVSREFRLGFDAFLSSRQVTPNGRGDRSGRLMQSTAYVLDTVRAMFEWAEDPERGNRLPAGFRNPFRRTGRNRVIPRIDPLAAPDISVNMAMEFVAACDKFQLVLMAPILLWGLRAAEPCYLFVEYFGPEWLRVPSNPDLEYRTKGGRDKSIPLFRRLSPLWNLIQSNRSSGLLYCRRNVDLRKKSHPLIGNDLKSLVDIFRQKVTSQPDCRAGDLRQIRNQLLSDAGGMTYDHVDGEFRTVARKLSWPASATLKDFRHLFATALHDAKVGELYRKYLMGHSLGRAAILSYTHLNQIATQYEDAMICQWPNLIDLIIDRAKHFGG